MIASSASMTTSPGRKTARPSDGELIERARCGDEAAFRELVDAYTPRVYAVAKSFLSNAKDAEDVAQEVFFKVHSKLDSFREDAAFSTWLYRVTMNAAADHRKKRRSDRSVLVEDLARLPLVDPAEGPDGDMDRDDLRQAVRCAMAELPEKFRAILVLRELEGLSYQEIGDILDLNKGTVESRLFRARARLKDQLERTLKNN